jgi:hypothetical protein
MHAGRSLFSGKASVQYLYFDKFKNERAWKHRSTGALGSTAVAVHPLRRRS